MVVADLACLHRVAPKLSELPPPEINPLPWEGFIRDHPAAWKKVVKAAAPDIDNISWAKFQSKRQKNVFNSGQVIHGEEGAEAMRECPDCGGLFPTAKGLTMRRAVRHEHASGVAQRIDTEWCPVCLRMFHTIRRT
eukprot:12731988-Alexandrium_andersonii.AAC.1